MMQFFLSGGVFMWLLLMLLVVNLILIAKKAADLRGSEQIDRSGIHAILIIGIASVALGMFGQILGLLEGYKAILTATDLSPEIVERGISISFHPTIFGFIICFLSAIAWYDLFRWSAHPPE